MSKFYCFCYDNKLYIILLQFKNINKRYYYKLTTKIKNYKSYREPSDRVQFENFLEHAECNLNFLV